MAFRITEHAQAGIRERQIPQDWVMSLSERPQQIVVGFGNRKIFQGRFKDADNKEWLLRLVVESDSVDTLVITAYKTSQVGRYWRES